MKKITQTVLLFSLLFPLYSIAAPATYTQQQVNALQVTVRTVLPNNITNVGDAIRWYVEPLGYYVLTEHPAPVEANAMLNMPIPATAKLHRTMPVLHAIQLLIGRGNTIIVDKAHKLITVKKGV
ncbi:hypothetical protein ACP6H1_27260 [Vibrio harveyi]|uniref:hypothetical protein n=1 Tax=Vibrio harveyi TaxID=669 RepID=UPI003CF94DC1